MFKNGKLPKLVIMSRTIYLFALLTCCAQRSFAVAEASDLPVLTKSPDAERPQVVIESMVVEVNGERRQINPLEGVTAVYGDLVAIVGVWTKDQGEKATRIQVEHLRRRQVSSPIDDKGRVFDTARDLRYTQGNQPNSGTFPIRVHVKGLASGQTRLQVISPKLLGVRLEVNGHKKYLSERDTLRLSANDGVKVIEIATNVRGNENVKHEILAVQSKNGVARKELRFSRGDVVFARIPIEWQNL